MFWSNLFMFAILQCRKTITFFFVFLLGQQSIICNYVHVVSHSLLSIWLIIYFYFFSNMKFNLRLKPTSKAKSTIIREQQLLRECQLRDAVGYCTKNSCRGWTAVKSSLFPLIKYCHTINKGLDGMATIGEEKEYCSILTAEEEKALVWPSLRWERWSMQWND